MSGICGVVRLDGKSVNARDIERQIRALAHRGPDGAQAHCDGKAGLAALRMRVTGEDSFDVQPLISDGLIFVSDARIDNREEIAAELAIDADRLRHMPDSALLFAAYRRWGPDCAARLVGDFVFAAWNTRERTLVMARDHMGQRHLFFHAAKDFFAFATERKGLWALPDIPRELTDASILGMLGERIRESDPTAGPDIAPVGGISGVPGGTVVLLAADGSLTCRRYWEPHADPAHLNRDEAYYVEAYRRVLGEAVACRLRRATAPAGLFMGGGFDSSAICALAGPVVTAQGRKLIAASSVMPEDYRGTIRHARKWVEMCRRDMPWLDVRYVTREGLDIFTNMERGFLATDGSHSTYRYVNDALYAAVASAGARIVMDGHGGDYTLNPRGRAYLWQWLRGGHVRRFAREWRARRRFLHVSHLALFKSAILPYLLPDFFARRRRVSNGLPARGPTIPIAPTLLREAIAAAPKPPRGGAPTMRQSIEAILRNMQNGWQMAGSLAAAAHGLEFTQPFHDKRVVELALAIPEALYAKEGRERYLAREALKDLYPGEYQSRGPGSDDPAPDFLAMAKRIEPKVLAEIARMEAQGRLSKFFDFARMRSMLTRRTLDQHASGNEYDTHQAMLCFLLARYVEWVRRSNA